MKKSIIFGLLSLLLLNVYAEKKDPQAWKAEFQRKRRKKRQEHKEHQVEAHSRQTNKTVLHFRARSARAPKALIRSIA